MAWVQRLRGRQLVKTFLWSENLLCDRSFKQPASHQWQHHSNRPSHFEINFQSDSSGPMPLQVAVVPSTLMKPSSQMIRTVSSVLVRFVEEERPWGIFSRGGHVAAVVSHTHTHTHTTILCTVKLNLTQPSPLINWDIRGMEMGFL